MDILPKLDEVKRLAAEGNYKAVPVSCEILSDFTTPIETMKILKNVFGGNKQNFIDLMKQIEFHLRFQKPLFVGFE